MPSRQKKTKSVIIKTRITPNQRIDLVKTIAARYKIDIRSAPLLHNDTGIEKLADLAQKPRPAHVPEENVYEKTHWLIIVAYLVATLAVYLLITNAG